MGGGRFSPKDWRDYTRTSGYDKKTRAEIFASKMDKGLNPHGVSLRESRDSNDNPNSTAVIIGLDVTGSMGMIAESMARKGLPTLVTEIYDRKPVSDPHIMCAAIGDVECDDAPLQITQFEADIRIAKQLEKFYLEGGGGGNFYESYSLLWYFASLHTSIDCFEKRKKKGILFTVGDEEPTEVLSPKDITKVLGTGPQENLTSEALLTMVSRTYDVFHIMVAQGSHFRSYPDRTKEAWVNLIGQRALLLTNYEKLSEVIVSAIQVHEGTDKKAVVESWDKTTSLVVASAVRDLDKRVDATGVVRF